MSDWIQLSNDGSSTFLCSVTTNEQKRGKKKSGQQKHARKSYFYDYIFPLGKKRKKQTNSFFYTYEY